MVEKYASKRRLDTTDHGRYIEENRYAIIRDQMKEKKTTLRRIRDKLEKGLCIDAQERHRLQEKEKKLVEELEELSEKAEAHAPR